MPRRPIQGISADRLPPDLLPDQAKLARIMIGFLEDLSVTPLEVRRCLDSLDEHGLSIFNYYYYYINLLSIFGDKKSAAEIRDLAIACVRFRLWKQWEGHVDAATLAQRRRSKRELPIRLSGWNRGLIDSILAQGRGLIITTAHYGISSYIVDDLTAMGYNLVIGLDSNSAYGLRSRLKALSDSDSDISREDGPALLGNGTIQVLDVENESLAVVFLAKALRRNQIVVLYFDGNSGMDGAKGPSNKSQLECFGYPIHMKTGVMQLSINMQTPLLPIFTSRTQGLLDPGDPVERGIIHPAYPIYPPKKAGGKEGFVQETLNSLFRAVETLVVADPIQWEGVCLLHRWRVSIHQPFVVTSSSADCDVEIATPDSCRLHINSRIIAPIRSGEDIILVNVRTLRVFKIKHKDKQLLSDLITNGIDKNTLPKYSNSAISCVKALSTLGFIEVLKS